MRKKRKSFYKTWLAFGVAQVALTAGAAQSPADTSLLFSEKEPVVHEQAGARAPLPVRISRTTFENEAADGRVTVQVAGQAPVVISGPLDWQLTPAIATEPAAQPGPGPFLVAFQDQVGCASFQGSPDLQICFEVMGDVDSLGVNPREMKLVGLDHWISPQKASGLHWVSAEKTSNGFRAEYVGKTGDSTRVTVEVRSSAARV